MIHLSKKKTDTKSCPSDKCHSTGKDPSSTPAHPSTMPKRVPPVFLWPAHAPLRHSPIHEVSSNQDDAEASGTQDTKDKKGPPDEADSQLSRNSMKSSHQAFVTVLNHIHNSMSSDEDFNVKLVAGKEFTSRMCYRSLLEASRPDVQGKIDKILSHSDPQPPDLVADYLKSWHPRILELHVDLESIFAFFVPVQQAGTGLHKYWGSVATLIRVSFSFITPFGEELMI
jgi:hypothetical protein